MFWRLDKSCIYCVGHNIESVLKMWRNGQNNFFPFYVDDVEEEETWRCFVNTDVICEINTYIDSNCLIVNISTFID